MRKSLNLGFNKRGNMITDGILFMIGLSVFAFIIVIAINILKEVNTEVQADSEFNTEAKQNLQYVTDISPTVFDYGVGLIVVLLWIIVVIFSFYIDTHPVFFGISFLFLIVIIIIANSVGDAMVDVTSDAELSDVMADLPITEFVAKNMVQLILAVCASIALALYAKSRSTV